MTEQKEKQPGQFLYHGPCEKCGSSDGRAYYEKPDGIIDSYCWVCKPSEAYEGPGDEPQEAPKSPQKDGASDIGWIGKLPSNELSDRGISKEAVEKYGVRVAYDQATGEISHHYYPVTKEGKIVGYKERIIESKMFSSKGDTKHPEFFGQPLFQAGRRLLCITEGEADALAAYDMFKKKGKDYAVVSVPHGAGSARRSAQDNLEWLESFESVVLMLDQDKQGKKAAKELSELLSPGKAKIATFSEKDANDMLLKGKSTEWLKAVYNAKEYRPDGIIRLSQTWDELWKDEDVDSIPYPWKGLNDLYYGIRPRELITITAGTGLGKSSFIRELEYWLLKQTTSNIGVLALEESVGRTNWGIMSIEANLPIHIREERKRMGMHVNDPRVKQYWESTIGTGRIIAYDHWGSVGDDNLMSRIRYMVKAMDCKYIFLDHLSIVVSDMEDMGDERKTIDKIMTRLRSLVEETGITMFLVSHLKRADGRAHELGTDPSLGHLRGSQSIAQLSDAVIGGSRNQQHDDEKIRNTTKLIGLKNRYAGHTGAAGHLYYARETGRLYEVEDYEDFTTDPELTYKDLII